MSKHWKTPTHIINETNDEERKQPEVKGYLKDDEVRIEALQKSGKPSDFIISEETITILFTRFMVDLWWQIWLIWWTYYDEKMMNILWWWIDIGWNIYGLFMWLYAVMIWCI